MKPIQEMPIPENSARIDSGVTEGFQKSFVVVSSAQPTPIELAMIAAPLRANAQSPYDDNLEAIKDAYALWQEARRFIEAQKEQNP